MGTLNCHLLGLNSTNNTSFGYTTYHSYICGPILQRLYDYKLGLIVVLTIKLTIYDSRVFIKLTTAFNNKSGNTANEITRRNSQTLIDAS